MTQKVELGFFFVLFASAALLSFFVLRPFLGTLFVAVVLAVVFYPVAEACARRVRNRSVATLCALLFLFFVVLIPTTLFGFLIFDDAKDLYQGISLGAVNLQVLDETVAPLEQKLQQFFPEARITPSEYLRDGLSLIVGNLGDAFSAFGRGVLKLLVMLLALFYLLRDGARIKHSILSMSPLANNYDEQILHRLADAVVSVVKGKLLIVILQGILAALVFFFFGLPQPMLLGAAVSFAALVPFVGVALVFVPAVLYFFVSGSVWLGVGLLAVGVVIGTIDNLLGPILYEKGLKMSPLFILLSVLGGFAFFGPVGFLAGPVTLVLFFVLLEIYPSLLRQSNS